jgi:hypothetical protein
MEATRFEQLVAGLESIFQRPLTDEERDSIVIWEKCRDLENFVSNFPHEWAIFKETLQSYASDYTDAWDSMKENPPKSGKDLEVLHGQVFAVTKVISSFIADVENAPESARQVPQVVKEGFQQMQAMPKDAIQK